MIFNVNEDNPQKRLISQTVDILKKGGVIIYPTDTVYAYGCDPTQKKAIEKIYRLKNSNQKKPLSFIFKELGWIHEYVDRLPDSAFKAIKKLLPGPYTFILKGSKLIPKIVLTKQKTVGVRIPKNNIAIAIVEMLGRPILSASINNVEGEFIIEPQDLEKVYKNDVDLIIDSGPKGIEPSTIVDFTDGIEIIREGKGDISYFEML